MATAFLLLGSYFIFIITFAVGVCWLWPDFVDAYDPPRIRAVLMVLLLIETLGEAILWVTDVIKPWMVLVIIICNGWGHLDAFLRYPIVHDIDSLFGLKQVFLITLKLAGYALGFRDVGKYVGWFVLTMLCTVFSLPILWLTALPIGDTSSYHRNHGVVDVDIVVRVWSFCRDPRERDATLTRWKVHLRKATVRIAQVCPCLKNLAVRWDPSMARMLRKAPCV